MVKGVSRRVVVVKGPDTHLFEQAIFFLRDDPQNQKGVSSEELMRQACRVADDYVRKMEGKRPRRRLAPLIGTLAGAGGMGVVWLLCAIL